MNLLFVALLASLLAASCAAVRTNITVTHALPAPAGKTVAIMPYEPSLASAPDYQSSAAKLAAHLQSRGYAVVAAPGGQADYIAFFHYGVDGELPVNVLVSRPVPPTGSIIADRSRGPYSHGTRRIYRRTVILEIVECLMSITISTDEASYRRCLRPCVGMFRARSSSPAASS